MRPHGFFQPDDFRILQRHLAVVPAAVLAPLVSNNPAQPGAEVAGDVETSDDLPGGDEAVLDEFPRPFRMAGEDAGVSEQRPVVIADEF